MTSILRDIKNVNEVVVINLIQQERAVESVNHDDFRHLVGFYWGTVVLDSGLD